MMAYASLISAVAGTALLAASLPASAQVVRFDPSVKDYSATQVTDVQFRRGGGHRFYGGGYGRGGFHGGYRHYGRRGGFGGRGAAIGAGVAGLAAGALIGGALASQAAPAYGYGYAPGYAVAPAPVVGSDGSAYCAQRYRSYDPASGTYLGYDGARHPCP